MSNVKGNREIASYFVTKHSWKGKYKRILTISTNGIATFNISTMECTNQWQYSEIVNVAPVIGKNQLSPLSSAPVVTSGGAELFGVTFKRGKKNETYKFSSEYRSDILCELLQHRPKFGDASYPLSNSLESLRYNCFKYHWSEKRISIIIEIGTHSVNQICPINGNVICSYLYKDIEMLINVSDYDNGFIISHGGFNRFHMFSCDRRDELLKKICDNSWQSVGIVIRVKKESLTLDQFVTNRFGRYSGDENLTSLCEFIVQKVSNRNSNSEPIKRIIAITDTCIVERDPNSYMIVTLKPLSEIFALVRCNSNPQLFSIEYVKGQIRSYTSTDRDSLLASLLDGVRASGNIDVHVKMTFTQRGHRLGPYYVPIDEEVESSHLRFLQNLPNGWSFNYSILRFNANCAYSGLLHSVTADGLFAENKEKLIHGALNAFIDKEGDQKDITNEDLEGHFQAIRRLVASKAGFAAFTANPRFRECLGLKVVKAIKRNCDNVMHAAIDMLCALLQPMHDDYDLRQEQLNKSSLLSSKSFLESLLDVLKHHVEHGTGALVVSAMLDFLTFTLCAPYSETTDGAHFDVLLEMVAAYGRPIFKLFQHPSLTIVKGAGLVMKAIIEEGDEQISSRMQELALAEGALIRHLSFALYPPASDGRFLAVQLLSRQLVGLWTTDNTIASALLKNVLPLGLLNYLDSEEQPPKDALRKLVVRDNLRIAQDQSKTSSRLNVIKDILPSKFVEKHLDNVLQHWRERVGLSKRDDLKNRPIVLRRRRERVKSKDNWNMLYYQFFMDHAKPDLIWNYKTREELRDALENEIRLFNSDRELSGLKTISWNHTEFEVQYASLNEEIKIGYYYLRLLLEENNLNGETNLTDKLFIKNPSEFFNDLYHRFLLTSKANMKSCCLEAMSIVYGAYNDEIGPFNDSKFIISMLDRCTDRLERDRLLLFIGKLILNKRNVKEIIDSGGIKILTDLLTLAHLHVNRATVPTQSNVIEASPEIMAMGSAEKEWYLPGKTQGQRIGPLSFNDLKDLWSQNEINAKTKCWAQGFDGWKPLTNISQLKWTFIASGTAIMNESDLSLHILKIFIKMCEHYPSKDGDGAVIRPQPKVKRLLTDVTCLPHIVQLLLTFDPILVEKVAVLLTLIMDENPHIQRLYCTGLFYFILMYTGSNVLPIGRLLFMSHALQSFRIDESQSNNITIRSILGPLLPEAMICYLENYGAEKFAQIFLGEYDTPEAIWNNEMRRLMIEKIASHIADFSPRLRSNTRAMYQYCPIPPIQYPQLENELFCNIYYLKNLCDTQQFPDWEIKDPVRLLKDILEAWKVEVEKKPLAMSVEDAFEVLGLGRKYNNGEIGGDKFDENAIRRAYFKLAQMYHPDKNPDGREQFEEVNKAYEFLCSRNARNRSGGPEPQNIILILKAQSILFSRYTEKLHPYKYSGYPMLIKTLQMETADEHLFSKEHPLLPHACETAYHTVNCSALNAEELRREGGFEVLRDAFSRCVSVLSASSVITDIPVQVCTHIVRCFTVAASFSASRQRLAEMVTISKDIFRILYFNHLTKLCLTAVGCISAFAADSTLQIQLYESGALFSLLLFLFKYDYTLEEGGVTSNEDTNQQEVANQLAKTSIIACARLSEDVTSQSNGVDSSSHLIRRSLMSLLTPYLCKQLGVTSPADTLKTLNSNIENPYLIWDNATRAELNDYLETQQREKIRSGECPDESYGASFVFSSHKDELIVGDIFIRVYNEQPMFPLENPKEFTMSLLDFLGSQAQFLYSAITLTSSSSLSPERVNNVKMCLRALHNVITHNPGVEIQCIGQFKLLFSLLRMEQYIEIQTIALHVIGSVTRNQECVKCIALSEVLIYLLLVLHTNENIDDSERIIVALDSMLPLMSNGKLIKEALSKGAVVYLLDLYCNSMNNEIREKSAELMAKMTNDKLNGPRIKLILCKFLPSIFIDAMKDSPEAAINLFEGTQENPELIWNENARQSVSGSIKRIAKELYKNEVQNQAFEWKLPEDFEINIPIGEGEIVVAGVYLRLFVQNPNWVIRKPKEFLTELMNNTQILMNKKVINADNLELVTNALTSLLRAQPALLEFVPAMGHVKGFIDHLSNKRNEIVPKCCLLIIHQMANDASCVISMVKCNSILSQIIIAISSYGTLIDVACEALNKMFQIESEELVHEAIRAEAIPCLLKLLDSKQSTLSSSTKAHIVQVLKSMGQSVSYGQQVNALLDKSYVWSEYRDQKHDLFITNSTFSGYITGGTANVAGYLTQGNSVNAMPSSPPPLEDY